MYRFLTSFASSNVGGPEQLDTAFSSAGRVEQSSISLCSAEQPVISLRLKMSSIRDVQAWLNDERVASCRSAQAQRIKAAAALLSQPKPRQEDVRPLQSKWKVPREKNNKKKRLEDVIRKPEGQSNQSSAEVTTATSRQCCTACCSCFFEQRSRRTR